MAGVKDAVLADKQTSSLRIAVEGCGHGTLDAIYEAVGRSCAAKGWDGVDVLIICGDFQAVRNHQDLNMTAMPAKYRKMGDFHQYYYGTKAAPYLTIFIGGNHEASNHLFELHYGGWAAPNIYYLGAANVIKLGPLLIAGTSGVYKKYDYRRPHFERLPYNGSEIRSIYHQRELDIRKLCSYRSQVDIGLSHDWPRGMEWEGKHQYLFAKKSYLRTEAENNELGSLPSALVLDRLRPPYWFSAHHHFRYSAKKTYKNIKDQDASDSSGGKIAIATEPPQQRKQSQIEPRASGFHRTPQLPASTSAHFGAVNAWHTFKNVVEAQDAEADAKERQEISARAEERARTGQSASANYQFEENFREVSIAQGGVPQAPQIRISKASDEESLKQLPQVDGTCCSVTKRRRESGSSDNLPANSKPRLAEQANVHSSENTVTNPDAIDIDMSDSDSDSNPVSSMIPQDSNEDKDNEHTLNTANGGDNATAIDVDMESAAGESQRPKSGSRTTSQNVTQMPSISEHQSQESLLANTLPGATATNLTNSIRHPQSNDSLDATTVVVSATSRDHVNGGSNAQNGHIAKLASLQDGPDDVFAQYVLDSSADTQDGGVQLDEEYNSDEAPDAGEVDSGYAADVKSEANDISDDVRAQLAQMSSTFAPEPKFVKSPHLQFPEGITNRETSFLALGKVEQGNVNDFLHLIEIQQRASRNDNQPETVSVQSRPYELEYDPEWLAITRVFASELELGGQPRDRVPEHRGETYYRGRILEEEKWVHENITAKGLLKIPKNFVVQTEQKDWDSLSYKEKNEMPRELTNPQTSQFCEMLEIPNPFDMSESERDARMARGPAVDEYQQRGGHRGRGVGRGGRGGRGGGGGGEFGGGRGRGGGSGRGRGRG